MMPDGRSCKINNRGTTRAMLIKTPVILTTFHQYFLFCLNFLIPGRSDVVAVIGLRNGMPVIPRFDYHSVWRDPRQGTIASHLNQHLITSASRSNMCNCKLLSFFSFYLFRNKVYVQGK